MFDMFDMTDGLSGITKAIVMTVSEWIVTLRARRRMKKSLGRRATDLELASLKTWMAVEETEHREEESGPIHPR
jgi:predicted metal-dependent hydrolase